MQDFGKVNYVILDKTKYMAQEAETLITIMFNKDLQINDRDTWNKYLAYWNAPDGNNSEPIPKNGFESQAAEIKKKYDALFKEYYKSYTKRNHGLV